MTALLLAGLTFAPAMLGVGLALFGSQKKPA
jgi:hypothetical protein